MAKIRIQKALSDAGIMSRRKVEEYIQKGKITVNGHKALLGNPVDIARDVVVVDGERVMFERHKENVYIALNKPRGYVTTTSDELGRRCVTELVKEVGTRLYPVGRLDKNTEGLLIMTNDGEFANLLMHPRSHVAKTYRLTVRPDITEEQLIKLSTGVQIGDDLTTLPASVIVLDKEPGRVVIQITITEGKNRQIRRMCEAVGLEVARLKRTSIGPLKLGMLQPGQWRALTKAEVISLNKAGIPTDAPVEEGSRRRRSKGYPEKSANGSAPKGRPTDDRPTPKGRPTGKPAWDKPTGDRPAHQGRPTGGKPAWDKPTGDRPAPKGRPTGGKPAWDKPTGDRPAPKGRPTGGKPAWDKPTGDRPAPKGRPTGGKPAWDKPTGDRPAPKGRPTGGKPTGGKPTGGRPTGKPASGRPAYKTDKPNRGGNR